MALRELNLKVLVQRMLWGAVLRRVSKAAASRSRFSEQGIRKWIIKDLQKYDTLGEKIHRMNQIDKELLGYINHNRQVKLANAGNKKVFVVDKSLEAKYRKEQPGKYKKQLPDIYRKQEYKSNGPEADVADLHKKGTPNNKNGQTNENPLKKEAETTQKEAANTEATKAAAPKSKEGTTSKPSENTTQKPKTNTEAQGVPRHGEEVTLNGEKYYYNIDKKAWQLGKDFQADEAARANRTGSVSPESADTGLNGYREYQQGETIKHGDKRLFDGKLKQFDENSGKWESIKDWEKKNNTAAPSQQQQGLGTRFRNWLIGPAAPAGSEVAWDPQGFLRRYADLRPYVEGRPFLYNPWVSSTALWTLAGGNEGHKRGYSYPDSYQVGFQSSPLMRILGIASGLTGVGDTFEEMERNGVIQKVNRNGNRQMVAAPQNYLDWDSLTDMDMAYNPYGGYMDNISPEFLED